MDKFVYKHINQQLYITTIITSYIDFIDFYLCIVATDMVCCRRF